MGQPLMRSEGSYRLLYELYSAYIHACLCDKAWFANMRGIAAAFSVQWVLKRHFLDIVMLPSL